MMDFSALVRSRSQWLAVMAVTFALGAGWVWLSAAPAAATSAGGRIPSPREGFAAPDFTLDTLNGNQVTLSDYRGQAVVINLWASWCPPCRAEMPAIQSVYERNRDRGLEILAVNTTYQDGEREAAAFVDQFNLTFTVPLDRTGEVARQYQLRALPSTFFVDREGMIRKVVIGGPMSESTIQTAVEEILEGGE